MWTQVPVEAMPKRPSGFINVDELMPQISLEQVAAFYGVELPELRHSRDEIRTRCFLNCGRAEETGDRAFAVSYQSGSKKWQCHQYECGRNGNLISICDFLKPGDNMGGRPRGQRFKEIASDLLAMTEGRLPNGEGKRTNQPHRKTEDPKSPVKNTPLADSPNERARELVNLDKKFTVDIAKMPPAASAYFRRRPFLTPDVCREWRMGYLPRDAGGDASGGTMRGKVVYPYFSQDGELLSWFGRDPGYEDKLSKWKRGGKEGPEPQKVRFVKGFHRGQELFGQHRIVDEKVMETREQSMGLFVVEGPNDVIRMDQLGVPVVGLCSNRITHEQVNSLTHLARRHINGIVTLMLDCDEEGEKGMKQAIERLIEILPVRLGWSRSGHEGRFDEKQPESLNMTEWSHLSQFLHW